LSLVSAVRAQVAGPTQDQPIYAVRTMEQIISGSLAERRFTMLVLIIFAATALLLAAVGIYGVMSYAVTRRTHELGIRSAFGSVARGDRRPRSAPRHATGAIGIAGGLMAAWRSRNSWQACCMASARPIRRRCWAAVALAAGTIALLACYMPARRATAVDPVIALRCE
jgi:putative ABC transport system permease protein